MPSAKTVRASTPAVTKRSPSTATHGSAQAERLSRIHLVSLLRSAVRTMSRTLSDCPHCKKSQRAIGPCRVCSGTLYQDKYDWESFLHGVWFRKQEHIYVHESCFEPAKKAVVKAWSGLLRCRDCGTLLDNECAYVNKGGRQVPIPCIPRVCPHCGRQGLLGDWGYRDKCFLCGLPIFAGVHQSRNYDYGNGRALAHAICVSQIRAD